ncbi:MAG: coiled coil domain-containing protein [Candidatus Atribacteria bacterium]|nr:coiled coil domain-containing protein [Candidatus Atribacteria bacterium]
MDRKAFIDKLDTQLKQWDSEIEKMEKAIVKETESDPRALYDKKIEEFRSKKEEAQKKLEELRKVDDDSAWDDLKSGAEKAFDNIKNTFNSVMSKFK